MTAFNPALCAGLVASLRKVAGNIGYECEDCSCRECADCECSLRHAEHDRYTRSADHLEAALAENAELRKRSLRTFDQIAADRMADEIAVLVRRRVIDARSPAGDALLDYRDPPPTARSDRMAELERELDILRAMVRSMKPVAEAADAWRDDPCKGLGSHREAGLVEAVDAYRKGQVP